MHIPPKGIWRAATVRDRFYYISVPQRLWIGNLAWKRSRPWKSKGEVSLSLFDFHPKNYRGYLFPHPQVLHIPLTPFGIAGLRDAGLRLPFRSISMQVPFRRIRGTEGTAISLTSLACRGHTSFDNHEREETEWFAT